VEGGEAKKALKIVWRMRKRPSFGRTPLIKKKRKDEGKKEEGRSEVSFARKLTESADFEKKEKSPREPRERRGRHAPPILGPKYPFEEALQKVQKPSEGGKKGMLNCEGT